MNNGVMQFAMNLINSNPQVQKNPRAQEMIDVIRQGDAVRGQQIAQNLCNTYGVKPNQAVQQASKFFNLH